MQHSLILPGGSLSLPGSTPQVCTPDWKLVAAVCAVMAVSIGVGFAFGTSFERQSSSVFREKRRYRQDPDPECTATFNLPPRMAISSSVGMPQGARRRNQKQDAREVYTLLKVMDGVLNTLQQGLLEKLIQQNPRFRFLKEHLSIAVSNSTDLI
jgi:hypothetical protein